MRPTIATTLGALVRAVPALRLIGGLALSATAAYHVKKLAQCVDVETRHFDAEREGYIKALGVARGNGGFEVVRDSPQWPDFVQRMTDLEAVPVEIAWGPVTLEMLGTQPVSANDLTALGPLFADPIEEPPA